MCSCDDTPRGVGCPIRTPMDQSLLAAPHGFSQRATSFIASWCQGIHRMPFSRSRSQRTPSTGPQRASTLGTRFRSMGTRHSPCTGTIHTRIIPKHGKPSTQHTTFLSPLNTPAMAAGALPSREKTSGQTCNHARVPTELVRWERARPETHQNLIHHTKEQSASTGDANSTIRHPLGSRTAPKLNSSATSPRQRAPTRHTIRQNGGGDRIRTDDPLLAKQVLSQLSYTPNPRASPTRDPWWAREDLNLRPHAYQACALTS